MKNVVSWLREQSTMKTTDQLQLIALACLILAFYGRLMDRYDNGVQGYVAAVLHSWNVDMAMWFFGGAVFLLRFSRT